MLEKLLQTLDFKKTGGLVPAIVQHARSGEVLMLGYMNDDAIKATFETKKVTFFSRSKNRLWMKGEVSGNVLHFVSMSTDCDADTLLVKADPVGPTCHLNRPSCFEDSDFDWKFLFELQEFLKARKGADPASSYTARLYAAGTKRIAQKVGEEGVETALAATVHDREELINEASDLVYHLLVLLAKEDLALSDVIANLKKRHEK